MTIKNKRILITCGPTWTPIDDTRIISNISSGQLGEIVAKELIGKGAKVTVLEGPVLKPLKLRSVKVIKFTLYDEFSRLLRKELKKPYDCLIHAAAVSDYKLEKPYTAKLSSHHKELVLDLVPTKKIIYMIKKWNPNVHLVGFKLSSHLSLKSVKERTNYLFNKAKCDLVVANSLLKGKYHGYILSRERKILGTAKSRNSIAKILTKQLKNIL